MNCPICGREMVKGELRSRGGVYFLPEGERRPSLHTENAMKKVNAISLPPHSLNSVSFNDWPEAYACRDCRHIMVKY